MLLQRRLATTTEVRHYNNPTKMVVGSHEA